MLVVTCEKSRRHSDVSKMDCGTGLVKKRSKVILYDRPPSFNGKSGESIFTELIQRAF